MHIFTLSIEYAIDGIFHLFVWIGNINGSNLTYFARFKWSPTELHNTVAKEKSMTGEIRQIRSYWNPTNTLTSHKNNFSTRRTPSYLKIQMKFQNLVENVTPCDFENYYAPIRFHFLQYLRVLQRKRSRERFSAIPKWRY